MLNAIYRTVMKSSVHAIEVHHGVNRRKIKIKVEKESEASGKVIEGDSVNILLKKNIQK